MADRRARTDATHETDESTTRRMWRASLVVLPVLVLATGWFVASFRAWQVRQEQWRRDRAARVAVVAAAVAEGLEDLRAREDERPYYVYSYYFTPPDLIGNEESVAVSPLGQLPSDTRVRGWFQIDPGARVRSPMTDEGAQGAVRERGIEIERIVREGLSDASLRFATVENTRSRENDSGRDVDNNSVVANPLYSQQVLRDIRAAQSGDRLAQLRNAERGRAPNRVRLNIPYGGTDETRVDGPASGSAPPSAAAGSSYGGGLEPTARTPALQRSQIGNVALWAPPVAEQGNTPATATATGTAADGSARGGRDRDGDDRVARYRPMAFARTGEDLFLLRTVTTDDATSLQGALLDRGAIRDRWLPAVLRRHAAGDAALAIVDARTAGSTCLVASALAPPLDDLAACARRTRADVTWRPFAWQVGVLGGVLVLVAFTVLARERALRRARQLARLERSFVASVSHELRTPLTTLRMNAEMLQEGWVAEARREKVIGQLVDETARLSRLIEDVLTFGRLAEGRATLASEPADLGATVRAIVDRERARLTSRGVKLDTNGIVSAVGAHIDRVALEQIVVNLLENAAKYASDANDRTVSVRVYSRDGRAVVSVRDRGPGIPESERERVFDRFYRGRDAVASHVAGTGLGLAIVRGLARAMEGDARAVAPDKGAGCEIVVSLPSASLPLGTESTSGAGAVRETPEA